MSSVGNKTAGLPESKRRGYSVEEIDAIYELGRLYLTSGNLLAAENIMQGLVNVVPDYTPAWLGLSYIHGMNHNHDAALFAARQAARIEAASSEAMLFLIAGLLTVKDFNTAGTYLGEIGDKIENGTIDNPYLIRFYKGQLVRYQNR